MVIIVTSNWSCGNLERKGQRQVGGLWSSSDLSWVGTERKCGRAFHVQQFYRRLCLDLGSQMSSQVTGLSHCDKHGVSALSFSRTHSFKDISQQTAERGQRQHITEHCKNDAGLSFPVVSAEPGQWHNKWRRRRTASRQSLAPNSPRYSFYETWSFMASLRWVVLREASWEGRNYNIKSSCVIHLTSPHITPLILHQNVLLLSLNFKECWHCSVWQPRTDTVTVHISFIVSAVHWDWAKLVNQQCPVALPSHMRKHHMHIMTCCKFTTECTRCKSNVTFSKRLLMEEICTLMMIFFDEAVNV